MMKKKIFIVVALPVLIFCMYFGLKKGYISPMIKALDIKIIGGTFITNINKYVIKVGDEVNISAGDYIVVPKFAKKPNLKFVILDNQNVLSINKNKIKAKKEGYSTIGIMNDNRVLRKATIMVVNPKINNLKINLDSNLKYYGDKSKIESIVDIDEYKKLEKGYKLIYSTTNPKVLKIEGDYVEAIGVGDAKLIARYDRKEIQTTIKILPRVDKIYMDKYYDIEQDSSINLKPIIETSPHNQVSEVKYTVLDDVDQSKYDENKKVIIGDSGVETSYGINIDKKGKVYANRKGTYKVLVSSGDKMLYTSISVKDTEFKNIEVKNLQYKLSKSDAGVKAEIGWDYRNDVNTYRIYVKKGNEDYELYTSIKTYKNNIPVGKRISTLLNFDKDFGKGEKYQVYVVGYNGIEETKPTNIINLSESTNIDFQSKKVRGVDYKIDSENGMVNLKWKPIDDKNKYTYRVYYVNNASKEDRFILLAKNIKTNKAVLKMDSNIVNYKLYVVAINQDGQISDISKPVNIYTSFSD